MSGCARHAGVAWAYDVQRTGRCGGLVKTVSVVIPTFNEASAVQTVIAEVREVLLRDGISPEIIVVDDGSKDGTAKMAAAAGARVLRHRSNRGYGAALKTGITAASNNYIDRKSTRLNSSH